MRAQNKARVREIAKQKEREIREWKIRERKKIIAARGYVYACTYVRSLRV